MPSWIHHWFCFCFLSHWMIISSTAHNQYSLICQHVLGRDVSGWIIKYLPYSYKYFSGPRKRGLSLFIRFPNESKMSNVIIHSYTEKICIKMDSMIRFSSPCVRNNTQYTAQQNYAQFCIPRTDSTHFCFPNVSSLFSRTSDSSIRWCTC